MILNKIKNFKSFCQHRDDSHEQYSHYDAIEATIQVRLQNKSKFHIKGYSWPAQSKSKFLVDDLYSHKGLINFRERLVCKKTQLNNRIYKIASTYL